MSPRRRALLLGGMALLLGGLAASDVAGREQALRNRLGPVVPVVVARSPIARGARIVPSALAIRRTPARYAPRGSFGTAAEVAGARAAGDVPAGTDLSPALVAVAERGAAGALAVAAPGERIARIVAIGAARELRPGSRVDVLVTVGDGAAGASTRVALRDAEVLESSSVSTGSDDALPRVLLALRVTLAQAVGLAQAQAAARELRALPRPPSADGASERPARRSGH